MRFMRIMFPKEYEAAKPGLAPKPLASGRNSVVACRAPVGVLAFVIPT
jgi:hypothetical protein